MTTRTSTYPLRLPVSIKHEAEKRAAAEGASLMRIVASAAAEKVAVLRTASYFAERRGRAERAAFDRLMGRERGEAPGTGDEGGGVTAAIRARRFLIRNDASHPVDLGRQVGFARGAADGFLSVV